MGKKALADHKFKKGVFIAPMNQLNPKLTSWRKERAPEYFWIALIIDYYGREEGLKKCIEVSKILRHVSPELILPKFSKIISLGAEGQTEFFKSISNILDVAVFAPLTLLITYSKSPIFSEFFLFAEGSPAERMETFRKIWIKLSEHQSEFSTDVRFIVVFHSLSSGKVIFSEKIGGVDEIANMLSSYASLSHDDEKMHEVRPIIRSLEGSFAGFVEKDMDGNYLNDFWEIAGKMDECELYSVDFSTNVEGMDEYISYVKKVMRFYTDIFVSTRPHDNRMLVLLGIATYSYKRLLELVENRLYHSIVGRSICRVLVEEYIMMKYLLREEPHHNDIWFEFQLYGLGKYKIIVERYRNSEEQLDEGHIPFDYLDAIVGEYWRKEFIDVDLKYFDNKNIRDKAELIGEKDLFDYCYDYDSVFEHGMWGAIRESSLLKCDSPLHQYHCVPDLENQQNVKSVAHDCRLAMEKIIGVLCDEYGTPPFIVKEYANDEKHSL